MSITGVGTQDRVRVQVQDPKGLLAGPWRMATGQGGEREVSTGYEEAGGGEVAMPGRLKRTDKTVERRFRPERDQAVVDALQEHPDWFDGTSITRVFLDAAYNPIPNARSVDSNLVMTSFDVTEADAESGEGLMLQIVFKALA